MSSFRPWLNKLPLWPISPLKQKNSTCHALKHCYPKSFCKSAAPP